MSTKAQLMKDLAALQGQVALERKGWAKEKDGLLGEIRREQVMRASAQRGLVANYEAAAVLVAELRKARLVKWAQRMWDLGLHREIAYDPARDLTLSVVSLQNIRNRA